MAKRVLIYTMGLAHGMLTMLAIAWAYEGKLHLQNGEAGIMLPVAVLGMIYIAGATAAAVEVWEGDR